VTSIIFKHIDMGPLKRIKIYNGYLVRYQVKCRGKIQIVDQGRGTAPRPFRLNEHQPSSQTRAICHANYLI